MLLAANQQIGMISGGSCDTKLKAGGSWLLKIQLCHQRNKQKTLKHLFKNILAVAFEQCNVMCFCWINNKTKKISLHRNLLWRGGAWQGTTLSASFLHPNFATPMNGIITYEWCIKYYVVFPRIMTICLKTNVVAYWAILQKANFQHLHSREQGKIWFLIILRSPLSPPIRSAKIKPKTHHIWHSRHHLYQSFLFNM